MDYTTIPANLIYQERKSLEDFFRENDLNRTLTNNMRQLPEFYLPEAEKLILSCLNTAYYICTIAFSSSNNNCGGIEESWPGIREIAIRAVNHDSDKYQKIIFALVLVLEAHFPQKALMSFLANKIHTFLLNKYPQNSHDEFNKLINGTKSIMLKEETFESISIIQALESADLNTIVRGYGYIEEGILSIGDYASQKYAIDLALRKFEFYRHTNEVSSVKLYFESLNNRIKSINRNTSTQDQNKNILLKVQGQDKDKKDLIVTIEKKVTPEASKVEWDSQYDAVFKSDLNPEKIFNKLENMDDPRVTDNYPRIFVFFRVLLYLSWIENKQKGFLKWANCHWKCNWEKEYNFKFSNNIMKELRDAHISEWNEKTIPNSDIGEGYRALAKRVLSVFTENVNGNKIIDRSEFYKEGVKCRINDGKNLTYPF